MHWAADSGHKEVAELLLAKGATVNVHDVAAIGDSEKFTALLKANPDLVSAKTPTAVRLCTGRRVNGCKDVVELLLANKAERSMPGDRLGVVTPCAHGVVCGATRPLAELLLANKAEVSAKGEHGMTPLHFAADENHKDVLELLLANKAEVNAKDNIGRTPLHLAGVFWGRKDMVELLLANQCRGQCPGHKWPDPSALRG